MDLIVFYNSEIAGVLVEEFTRLYILTIYIYCFAFSIDIQSV